MPRLLSLGGRGAMLEPLFERIEIDKPTKILRIYYTNLKRKSYSDLIRNSSFFVFCPLFMRQEVLYKT